MGRLTCKLIYTALHLFALPFSLEFLLIFCFLGCAVQFSSRSFACAHLFIPAVSHNYTFS